MIDPVEFGKHMASVVRDTTAPLVKRIEELERLLSIPPAEMDIDLVAEKAARLVPITAPASIDMDAIAAKAATLVQLPEPVVVDTEVIAEKAAKLVLVPEPAAVDMDVIAAKAAKLVPTPKDGESVSVESVATSVSASFERRFSDMQLSWERQARDTFEKAVDRMPVPKDGKDAVQIDDLEVMQDGRDVTLKLGDTVRTFKVDSIVDRGVWRAGDYEKGDAVSYGGSLWIAQDDKPEDAPGTSKQWRLAVKKGRDGRDLRDNASTADKSKGVIL